MSTNSLNNPVCMNRCSYFIPNKALFGSYPSQEIVNELEEHGVEYFVNLTHDFENKIVPYITKTNFIHYPITDGRIPINKITFSKFISMIVNIIQSLKKGQKIYIHCKGGHGRSGVVVACILCKIYNMNPYEALKKTSEYHNNRPQMKDIWRKIGSPQTKLQKKFVIKMCQNLYFYKFCEIGKIVGFSNFSKHSVTIPNVGTFPTAENAFQAYKNLRDKEYIDSLIQTENPGMAKMLGRKTKLRHDWSTVRDSVMENVLRLKLEQHEQIKKYLLSTGLRPIINYSKLDSYWGTDENGKGKNIIGKILEKLRSNFYRNNDF